MRSLTNLVLALALPLAAQQPGRIPPAGREYAKDKGRGEGKLQAGDRAPDFRLKRQGADSRVSLSSFQGRKPVALLFGSYT
jgi:hypothetical protein